MPPKPRFGQKVNTTIQRLGVHGEGIGYWHGYTLFVDGALPGEVVQARLIEQKKRYGRGRLLQIDRFSPNRVAPVCPLAERCGGCQVMHLQYASQLEEKRQRVVDALQRIGKIEDIQVSPCLPSPSPLHYRNKIQAPIRSSTAGLSIGFYARSSHDLVDVDRCFIHCALGEQVFSVAKEVLNRSGMTAYDWETGTGTLRYLIIKSAIKTGQVLVILVTNGTDPRIYLAAEEIARRCPEVKGVVQNLNSSVENVVLGEEFLILFGEGKIEEEILGLRFKVSPASFFQVNPLQAEQLYLKALACAELQGNETVIDAFCGVGTLALLFAQHAKKVIGVECVLDAVNDARENAKRNGIENAVFIHDEAERWIQQGEPAEVILLNPPRKGCDPSLLEQLRPLGNRRIVYISCDPATLARDLSILRDLGWGIETVQPVDMFPQTAHVETLAKLSPSINI